MMDEILGMKVLFYFLFAFSSVVECRNLFVPAGPPGTQASQGIGEFRSPEMDKKDWQIGELGTKSKKELLKYLSNFGYTSTYTDGAMKLNEGLKDFQFFAGIPTTGRLDAETVQLINTDRCGIKDPRPAEKRRKAEEEKKTGRSGRWRRYNHQGSTWKHLTLTWQYLHNPWQRNKRVINEDQIRNTMKTAMKLWSDVTNIEFKEDRRAFTVHGKNEPDILVRFVSDRVGGHAKIGPFPFDGKGGVLAHAFYPLNNKGNSGDVHFDDDEDFTLGGARQGYEADLQWVAVHELGHTLGLDHSRNQGAIMYPFYRGYRPDIQLTNDDRLGVQTLYGGKIKKKKVVVPQCPTTDITAISNYGSRYRVVTKDKNLYEVKKDSSKRVKAVPTNQHYKLPSAVDAVYQTNLGTEGGRLYDVVFTDRGYYIYQGLSKVSGPHIYTGGNFNRNNFCRKKNKDDRRTLKINFPANVRKIDAVLKWQRNSKVYFFTGLSYYRYDEKRKMMDCGYPRLIEPSWRGLPGNIDAAYSSADKTFFIKGDKIYYFDDELVRVKGDPKDIKRDLLRC